MVMVLILLTEDSFGGEKHSENSNSIVVGTMEFIFSALAFSPFLRTMIYRSSPGEGDRSEDLSRPQPNR